MTDKKHKRGDEAETTTGRDAQAREDATAQTEGGASESAQASAPTAEAAPGDHELAEVSAQRDEYLDHLRRLKAEFENYRKRVRRDNEELRLRAAETVVESLLPVMDNMGRALQAAARHEEGQLIAGLELVAGQLKGTLEGHGLERLDVVPGVLFDPNLHEAILTQESDAFDHGQVAQVLEDGYLLHGRLLRAAKVIVAR